MSPEPVSIRALDGMPAGEIREAILKGDVDVAAEARRGRARLAALMRGSVEKLSERVGKLETEVCTIKVEVCNVKDLATESRDLALQAVAQNKEILERFDRMAGEVKEITEETADGVKVVTRVKRWGQTVEDFHLDKWGKRVVGVLGFSIAMRGLGWAFGPELRDRILHVLMLR